MREESICILLVGTAREARWLRGVLGRDGGKSLRIARAPSPDVVPDYVSRERPDVLLLDLDPKQPRENASALAVRAATSQVPVIVLSPTEDHALALHWLRHGAQDFLAKGDLDYSALSRALHFAVERHRLQKTLQTLSLLDDLTGLNNRRGFLMLAEQHLRLIQRKGGALLVYIDVDNLKKINDTYGHTEGNHALIVTANVLRACFRQSDILARLGGDEFCVLMIDASKNSVRKVRQRLQQQIGLTNALSAWRFRLSLSVGIAEVPTVHQPSLEELLKLADALMYEHKRQERSATRDETPALA